MSPDMASQQNGDVNGAAPAPSALLQAVYTAADQNQCSAAASQLAQHVQANGLETLYSDNILPDLLRASKAKSGIERESALIGLASLFNICGQAGGADPYFLPLWPEILERYQEVGKAQVVCDAAERASKALLALVKPETTVRSINILFDYLETSSIKWRCKAGALDTIAKLTGKGKDQVAAHLGEIIPRLTTQMSDTKVEVSSHFASLSFESTPLTLPYPYLFIRSGLNRCSQSCQHCLWCLDQPRCLALRSFAR